MNRHSHGRSDLVLCLDQAFECSALVVERSHFVLIQYGWGKRIN
jgi:hypothetical protein